MEKRPLATLKTPDSILSGYILITHIHVVVLLWLRLTLEPLVVRAVLGVLLVLWVEIVDGIGHDVPGVHRLPQGAGDALHRHVPPRGVSSPICHVCGDRESIFHRDSSKEHLDADQKVLISC